MSLTEEIVVLGQNGFMSEPENSVDHENAPSYLIELPERVDGVKPPDGAEQEEHDPNKASECLPPATEMAHGEEIGKGVSMSTPPNPESTSKLLGFAFDGGWFIFLFLFLILFVFTFAVPSFGNATKAGK